MTEQAFTQAKWQLWGSDSNGAEEWNFLWCDGVPVPLYCHDNIRK